MSTPSSRLVLVTTALSSPALSADSTSRRLRGVERRMVRRHPLDRSSQVVGDLLGQGARVGEDDRGAVPADLRDQSLQQPPIRQAAMRPLVVLQQRLDLQVQRPGPLGGRGLDDPAGARGTDQEVRDGLGGPAGGREADAGGVAAGVGGQALQRDGQVDAPLGRDEGVDLVDDQVIDLRPGGLPGLLAQQQRKALGRGDEQVRRLVAELPAPIGRGVARPHADAHGALLRAQVAADRLQGFGEVPLDVVAEAPQGRDVHATQSGRERAREVLAEEPVEDRKEGGEGLARPGRRDEEQVLARGDRRPGQPLRGGRPRREGAGEPVAHRSVEVVEVSGRHPVSTGGTRGGSVSRL